MSWIRRNLEFVLPVTAVVLFGVGFLAFGVFGVHTLFIDDMVDEDGPVFDSGVAAAAAPVETVAPEPDQPIDGTAPAADDSVMAEPQAPLATEAPTPQIVTLAEGSFIPRGRYSGEGRAVVLKGNIGDQNYEIPPDVDLSVYDTVVVWCVRFSTPFTAADLV